MERHLLAEATGASSDIVDKTAYSVGTCSCHPSIIETSKIVPRLVHKEDISILGHNLSCGNQVNCEVVNMTDLRKLWEETREFVHRDEQQIADRYISFLREVAKHYISRDKRVFFRENRVVHYGEGGFGGLLVECDDDEYTVFGTHVLEIEFKQKLSDRDLRGYSQITMQSLENMKYQVD